MRVSAVILGDGVDDYEVVNTLTPVDLNLQPDGSYTGGGEQVISGDLSVTGLLIEFGKSSAPLDNVGVGEFTDISGNGTMWLTRVDTAFDEVTIAFNVEAVNATSDIFEYQLNVLNV